MKVIRAESMGLCFGVRDALAVAEKIDEPESVTIHGQLVHNERVLVQLATRGFRMSGEQDRERLSTTSEVLITAHGISNAERRRLESAGKNLIDTTCPLVRRVHETAQTLAVEERHVIVIGQPGHVEVRGIVEDLPSYNVVSKAEDVKVYRQARLGIVCQTTTSPHVAEEIHRALCRQNPHADIRHENTICQPTIDRQQAIRQLAQDVDLMVVVGGRNSNNTRQLVDLARKQGVRALHVQSVEDLDATCFANYRVVGLTAGTSTLDETVDEIHEALLRIESVWKPSRV